MSDLIFLALAVGAFVICLAVLTGAGVIWKSGGQRSTPTQTRSRHDRHNR